MCLDSRVPENRARPTAETQQRQHKQRCVLMAVAPGTNLRTDLELACASFGIQADTAVVLSRRRIVLLLRLSGTSG